MHHSRKVSRRFALLVAVALGALMLVPASGLARTKFGAKLRANGNVVEPTEPAGGRSCKQSDPDLSNDPCTRVAVRFHETGAVQGHVKAPRKGKLRKLKIVASGPGSFTPYLARVKDLDTGLDSGKARVKKKGHRIEYEGDNTAPYTIEKFPFRKRVKKGDYLAIKSDKTSLLQCETDDVLGSLDQLLFQPPLALGDSFEPNDGSDDCTLLTQAVYKKKSG